MPGCCSHFRYTLRTSLITFWRTMGIKIFFLAVMCFAAAFLSVMDAIIFDSPPWSATSFLNAQIALALLIAVYSLQLFSNDQEMYWREASHGLNRFAFFAGRALVNTFDWLLLTFFFLLVYFSIARPILAFEVYIWPFFLVSYVASGWGYALSCCLPVELGAFISSILMFMMGGILGLPMQMADFLNGGFFEIVVSSISFTRWSVSMSFLEYVTEYPPDPKTLSQIDEYQLTKFRDAYDGAHFLLPCEDSQYWSGLLALVLQGSVLRLVAYLGLRFTNRARQI
ncbi:ABCG25 [Symbiodinium microadriaticum]|nr:ABCG25 [Symbiodinium microadriaticum]